MWRAPYATQHILSKYAFSFIAKVIEGMGFQHVFKTQSRYKEIKMEMHFRFNRAIWIVFVVSNLAVATFQQPGLAQYGDAYGGYNNDPYDIDHDGMRDMNPYPGGSYPTSPTYPVYPTYPNNTQTGWVVCNASTNEQTVYVAYSYYDGQAWVREGWRAVSRDQCSRLTIDILTRYIYLYAEGINGTKWGGDKPICVHPMEEFLLPPMDECSAPYEYRSFMTIDTGDNRGWITTLY